MDLVGRLAVFQHNRIKDDPWNGERVHVLEAYPGGLFRVKAVRGGFGETLAMREELTVIEEED